MLCRRPPGVPKIEGCLHINEDPPETVFLVERKHLKTVSLESETSLAFSLWSFPRKKSTSFELLVRLERFEIINNAIAGARFFGRGPTFWSRTNFLVDARHLVTAFTRQK